MPLLNDHNNPCDPGSSRCCSTLCNRRSYRRHLHYNPPLREVGIQLIRIEFDVTLPPVIAVGVI